MKKFKLLFIDYHIPYLLKDSDYPTGPVGGAAVDQLLLIEELSHAGQKVGILTWDGAKEYIEKKTNFDIIYGETSLIQTTKNPIKIIKNIISAIEIIGQYRPDYLCYKCEGNPAIIALIGSILKIPLIYRIASDSYADTSYMKERKGVRKLYNLMERYALNYSTIIFCQNQYQYRHISKRFPNAKAVTIHDFYDLSRESLTPKKVSERKYIAWIGRFVYDKNLPQLLEIAQKLPHIEFKVAGKLGENPQQEIIESLKLLKKCKNVQFVGHLNREEIIPFLSDAYALLNTSFVEGFSRTFLEALVSGTPIVATTKVDPDDIIATNGLGVIAKNHDNLADSIILLLENREFDRIALTCIEYVVEHHDSKLLIQKFIKSL